MFPSAWLTSEDEAEIERQLDAKGIVARTEHRRLRRRARRCRRPRRRGSSASGFADVRTLRRRLPGLGGRRGPADRAPAPVREARPHRLAARAHRRRDARRPTTAGGYLLFHVNFGVPEEYEENHLPGALYLDTNRLEDPADWNRRSPAEIEATLLALGITADTTVVLYGRDTVGDANEKWPGRRAGQIAATRAALILSYAGVERRAPARRRLRLVGQRRPSARDRPARARRRSPAFGVPIPQRPDFIVDIDEAKEIIADDLGALVSVRTWHEHIGKVSGYNYIGPAGRIAGDVWGNCGTDAYHMQHYRNIDNTMRAYPEIAANWAEAGITPDKRVAFYCGTGWRASRDLVLRPPDGLAAHRRLRRRLVRVERGPGQQPDRGRRPSVGERGRRGRRLPVAGSASAHRFGPPSRGVPSPDLCSSRTNMR